MQLDIRNISRTYPNGVEALKDVTLTIPPGMYGLAKEPPGLDITISLYNYIDVWFMSFQPGSARSRG